MIQLSNRCDRCLQAIDDFTPPSGDGFTAGYYSILPGGYWQQFANLGERVVCDVCMWLDPRYIAVYGPRML